jgi:type I restriction enzyme, R subunit
MRRKRGRIDEMKRPTEHKTVQSRILAYAEEIGWTYVPRAEAERRRGFDPAGVTPEEVLPQRNAKENAR